MTALKIHNPNKFAIVTDSTSGSGPSVSGIRLEEGKTGFNVPPSDPSIYDLRYDLRGETVPSVHDLRIEAGQTTVLEIVYSMSSGYPTAFSRLRKKGVSVKLPCRWSQEHDDVRP